MAQKVIDDPARWVLTQVAPGEASGSCCQGNCPPWNEKGFAVIACSYDQTISDAVYIAHELGHLFVFDALVHETPPYPPSHLAEIQHYIGEVTRSLYNIPIGMAILNADEPHATDSETTEIIYADIMRNWLGNHWNYYERAEKVLLRFEDAMYKKDQILYAFHQHCMGNIVSLGLSDICWQAAPTLRRRLSHGLLHKHVQKDISFILQVSGIDTDRLLDSFAKRAIALATHPLLVLQK